MRPAIFIETLRDGKGAYGYAIIGADEHHNTRVILRPDRIVPELDTGASWLQQVPPLHLFPRSRLVENDMVETLAKGFLRSSGVPLTWDEEYVLLSPDQKLAQRRHYFAAMARSRRIVNSVIREVIAEATDPEIVHIARRFPREARYRIYRHISRSHYAAQLAEVHPLLAHELYRQRWHSDPEDKERLCRAREMVMEGRLLRDVLEVVGAPKYLRVVHPGATGCVSRVWPAHLIAHLPKKMRAQQAWFSVMDFAASQGATANESILSWTARHASSFGHTSRVARAAFSNVFDWILASEVGRSELIRRPFSPDMSLATVRELSDEWHYAVAMADHSSNATFPKPWLPEKTVGHYTFKPITTPQELFLEGKQLHNCLATYVNRVTSADTFIYSVRRGNERIAALALQQGRDGRGDIGQIAGPCNAPVSNDVMKVARQFVRQPITKPKPTWKFMDDDVFTFLDDDAPPF